MTKITAARRPAIHMIDDEAETLTDLAIGLEEALPQVSELLLEEISRARLLKRSRIASEIVIMGSMVEFVDETRGTTRTVQLVYPRDADISSDRISIATPIGAGLIGLRPGQSIKWPDRNGKEHCLRIVRVSQVEEAR